MWHDNLRGDSMKGISSGKGVQIGMSAPPGLAGVKLLEDLKLGNCLLTMLPPVKADAFAMARYCRGKKIYLFFDELLYRGTRDLCRSFNKKISHREFYSKKDLEKITTAAGEYYGGRMVIGEAGGVLYWPKAYLIRRRAKCWVNLPAVHDVDEARENYLRYLRQFMEYERTLGGGPFLNVDSSLVFKYHAEAGIDILCLEMMPGDPYRMTAAIRGAANACCKPWGTHIACCYGGVSFDELWLKRWKTSLLFSYISGSRFIWPESGHLSYMNDQSGKIHGFHHPRVKAVRQILRETYRFSQIHGRPADGPQVTLGVVHGYCDGAPGLWNPYAWGQFHDRAWLSGPAEQGWDLLDLFHRREQWTNPYVQGTNDFSGQPPYGQYNIVPVEADLETLKQYRCLLFLGWNTMTAVIYKKLKAYVASGGHLVMSLPHLGTQTGRTDKLQLFRQGRIADLFGVTITGRARKDVWGIKCMANSSLKSYRFPLWRIKTDPRFLGEFTPAQVRLEGAKVLSGYDNYNDTTREALEKRPFLVEHTVERGKAFLVLANEYPASAGLLPFTKDLIRTVLAGEQGSIRVLAPDGVRYSVYSAGNGLARHEVIYLLNTDPDAGISARLWINGVVTDAFMVPPAEMRVVYRIGSLILVLTEKCARVDELSRKGQKYRLKIFSVSDQEAVMFNLSKKSIVAEINNGWTKLAPGGTTTVRLPRKIESGKEFFYANNFLNEPEIYRPDTRTPY